MGHRSSVEYEGWERSFAVSTRTAGKVRNASFVCEGLLHDAMDGRFVETVSKRQPPRQRAEQVDPVMPA